MSNPLPTKAINVDWETTRARSSKRTYRLSFIAATIFLTVCVTLILYFTVIAKKDDDFEEPHEWYITREMWRSPPFTGVMRTTQFEPLRILIIAHSASMECNRFSFCVTKLQNLQEYYQTLYNYDLPYNFLIGNDARVYEGRGWSATGAHTARYNNCSMAVAFIGDYREGMPTYSKVTQLQIERAHMLFEEGIRRGILHPEFKVLGARDVGSTNSPGDNLYNEIRKWPNYAHDNIYENRNCTNIQELFGNDNTPS